MKKLCIFDFDGTIFNTIDDIIVCVNKSLDYYNLPKLSKQELRENLGGNVDEILALILGDNHSKESLERFKKTYFEYVAEHDNKYTKPFDGTVELLEKLQDHDIKLSVNSNRTPDSISFFLDKFMNDIDFVDIQGHVYTNPSKPDPYGVNHILNAANLKAEDTLYIGDSGTDIQTARNAGVDCVIVKWGYSRPGDIDSEYPLAYIDNPEQLLDIIFKSKYIID